MARKKSNSSDGEPSSDRVTEHVTIYLRGATWWARYQAGQERQRRSLKTRSKKEARNRAVLLEAEILKGQAVPQVRVAQLTQVFDDYRASQKAMSRSERTIEKTALVTRRATTIAQKRGARLISQLDLQFVDQYRAAEKERGNDPSTIENHIVILRQIVNFALARKMLAFDPLAGLVIKKIKAKPQPCWTQEEMASIFPLCGHPQREVFEVLAETAMRIGEAQHLTWDDVDFERGVLEIRPKTISLPDGSQVRWQPKSRDRRSIPMSKRAREVLASLPRQHVWVFTSRPSSRYPLGGQRLSESRLLAYLKRRLATLGLVGKLHTFRHSFISHALIQGVPEAILREWVGHVDAEIMRHYTHIASDASRAAMQRLDSRRSAKPNSGEQQS